MSFEVNKPNPISDLHYRDSLFHRSSLNNIVHSQPLVATVSVVEEGEPLLLLTPTERRVGKHSTAWLIMLAQRFHIKVWPFDVGNVFLSKRLNFYHRHRRKLKMVILRVFGTKNLGGEEQRRRRRRASGHVSIAVAGLWVAFARCAGGFCCFCTRWCLIRFLSMWQPLLGPCQTRQASNSRRGSLWSYPTFLWPDPTPLK